MMLILPQLLLGMFLVKERQRERILLLAIVAVVVEDLSSETQSGSFLMESMCKESWGL